MKKNILLITIGLLILSLALAGCTSSNAPANNESKDDKVVLKVGATPVPHSEILNLIKPKLEEKGITLEIIEFTDYVKPNLALDAKEIDANFFQHVPYMESFAREHKIQLASAAKVHVEPLGLYSKKIKSVDELRDGAVISIPNDPTNEGRALILLEAKGYIKLKENAGLEATDNDIIENPKNLVFEPIDAAQLPRTLDDVDASVINTNYALEAGLNPSKDALIIEGSESPYANILTIRPDDKENESIKKLVEALQSEKVKNFIEEQYKGAVVPAF
ncbi:MetQ/NlpA family ABC transporter substrate-binding protein [Wukongibacter baidiensis]|uniref:MetQ/NlpA family ABC transporter substrate-binding protein n=1 Tax=Wukongibacter baidiensis TaxID=1723361 RepID=UPI003D7F6766